MATHSDALVFFGITGDLAYKKIFPALHAMIRRKTLDIPIIGVARDDFTLDKLKERAHASINEHGGGVDPAAIKALDGLLSYVKGEYSDKKPSWRCTMRSRAPADQPSTSPFHRFCSDPWSNICQNRSVTPAHASSLKSPSATIGPRRKN
jgi:hypothetical protein